MHESEQESNVHGPYAVKCMGHCDCVGAVSWLEDGRREDFWVTCDMCMQNARIVVFLLQKETGETASRRFHRTGCRTVVNLTSRDPLDKRTTAVHFFAQRCLRAAAATAG